MSDVVSSRPTDFSRQKTAAFHYTQPECAADDHIMQLGSMQSSKEVPYFVHASVVSPQPETRRVVRKTYPALQSSALGGASDQWSPERLSREVPHRASQSTARSVSQEAAPIERTFHTGYIRTPSVGSRKKSFAFGRGTKKVIASRRFLIEDVFSFLSGRKFAYVFGIIVIIGFLSVGSVSVFSKGMKMKGEVLGVSQEGFASLNDAARSLKDRRFDQSALDFEKAAQAFSEASQSFDEWSTTLVDVSRFFPVISKLSSGKNAVEAGKHIALAGQRMNSALSVLSTVKNPLDTTSEWSLLEVFQETQNNVSQAKDELILAQESLDNVKEDDLPEDKRERFAQVKTQLPVMIDIMERFSDSSDIFSDLLGGNGPRKYLFLFQNNHEMRATGGFIGSYGLLDIANGRVRNFFVDGIFNPDGQLKENIVPPKPVQKVSASWSLHDSNWFPDFPTSAEKAISFYEKTGGPTVDGVITLTPTVMQKLLRVTGPIRMDAYDKTLDADNFIEEVQQEVEVDYDKTANRPKQILADLAPILLDRLFNVSDAKQAFGAVQAFEEGLGEKQILLYSRNADIEKIIDDAGWSGRMLDAQKDYLSVINTNINGYKTDGVVDESIDHEAIIQDDGSIIDTVTITRKHNGGHMEKDWWNKVNANYMRVYVPQGSMLLDAQGQTRETVESPLDYDRLGFRRDADVEQEASSMTIDPNTGTSIYDQAGKTVFANWVYVSPQETVTLTYRYLLPFKVQPELESKGGFDSYALTLEKQSGSFGSRYASSLRYPMRMKPVWQSEQDLLSYDGGLRLEGDLKRDRFMGVVFSQ